jgi:hypothetical protein
MLIAILFCAVNEPSELAARLGHEDPEIREKATAEAIALGRPALKTLRILMDSDDPEVAGRAEKAFKAIAESLKAEAVRFEITLNATKVRKGARPDYTAKLVNVDVFPVEVLCPEWGDDAPCASAKQVQKASFSWREAVAWKPVTLKPGESIDVTQWTRPDAWPSTAGKHTVRFQMRGGRLPSFSSKAVAAAPTVDVRMALVEIEILEE